jgi:hypothetical protein
LLRAVVASEILELLRQGRRAEAEALADRILRQSLARRLPGAGMDG